MTTKELKKELEELGLSLKYHAIDKYVYYKIEDEDGECYGWINLTVEFAVDMDAEKFEDQEKQRKLFNTVTKYAMTSVEERDPKRYFRYKLKPFAKAPNILNRYLSYDKFGSFLDLQVGTETFQTIFEENDPLLDEVNLEMFEAIEVDAEGNEMHD